MIKRGYLSYYNRCFCEFFSKWKICYVILYNDSTFEWYINGKKSRFTDRIKLQKVYKYIAIGRVCDRVPIRPDLPDDIKIDLMIGIPYLNTKNPTEMEFFHFTDQDEMALWMTAIESVLSLYIQPYSNVKIFSPNEQSANNNSEIKTNFRRLPEKNMNNNYYYANKSQPYVSHYDAGMASSLGIGIGLGTAMSMPLWATSSAWCHPTIINTGIPDMGIHGCSNDSINMITSTTTTTDMPADFGMTVDNDFGGFGGDFDF